MCREWGCLMSNLKFNNVYLLILAWELDLLGTRCSLLINPLNLALLNQTKNIPVILPSFPIKCKANWSTGSEVRIEHRNKQTEISTLNIYTHYTVYF